eukprot:473678-Prorocentrum_lima.AAC.1
MDRNRLTWPLRKKEGGYKNDEPSVKPARDSYAFGVGRGSGGVVLAGGAQELRVTCTRAVL